MQQRPPGAARGTPAKWLSNCIALRTEAAELSLLGSQAARFGIFTGSFGTQPLRGSYVPSSDRTPYLQTVRRPHNARAHLAGRCRA
jgi:hypothetical protein